MKITSDVFVNGGSIPSKYTCDASSSISPPLDFSNLPAGTKSLALIMDDPDVPKVRIPSGVFDHWVLYNISPSAVGLKEGVSIGVGGVNSAGKIGYASPCPPPEHEPAQHRYIFVLYALDTMLDLKPGANKQELIAAMQGHIIEQSKLIGKYKRINASR